MTDRDDEIARRYRALPREEPPPALDAAILAHSRRAAAARPGGLRRWSGPLSIAAVLVLAVGIVSRMQVEQPGIETSAPAPAPASAPPAPPPPQPAVRAEVAQPRQAPRPSPPAAVEKRVARAPEAPAPAAAPAPAPQQVITVQSAAPSPPQAFRPDERMLDTQRAKVAASAAPAAPAAESVATDSAPLVVEESPEATLERIVRLRAEGRHDEADRALEQFRKRYPDYRIPEGTLKRVLRPTP